MATYRHGIYVSEQGTELISLARQAGGLTFVVGTAPIREAAQAAEPNEPVLCTTYNDAVAAFGYSTDTAKYTLCEAMEVLFGLYQVSPVVMVNVFDPAVHKEEIEREKHLVTSDHTIELSGDILTNSIKVEKVEIVTEGDSDSDGDEEEEWVTVEPTNIEYTLEKTTLTFSDTYMMGAQMYVTYAKPDVTKVTALNVSGAVDTVTGKSTGLELVNEVYARFGYTVGQIIAPGFSHLSEVGLKMAAKAELINQHFSAIAIADLDTSEIGGYSQAMQNKTSLGYSLPHLIACYPAVKYGERVQHLSTHIAGILASQAADDDDIPFRSPSNKTILISGMCNLDGSANYFGDEAANVLNGQGIVTVTNFNGWKAWGNRTSAYPTNTDPKDAWISVRRMFDFIKARLVLGFWSTIDEPIMRRTIDSVVNSANTYLNGLVSAGALLGGRVEFNEADNSETDIMDGKLNFRCWITPPSPAEQINFTLKYDSSYLSNVLGVSESGND